MFQYLESTKIMKYYYQIVIRFTKNNLFPFKGKNIKFLFNIDKIKKALYKTKEYFIEVAFSFVL